MVDVSTPTTCKVSSCLWWFQAAPGDLWSAHLWGKGTAEAGTGWRLLILSRILCHRGCVCLSLLPGCHCRVYFLPEQVPRKQPGPTHCKLLSFLNNFCPFYLLWMVTDGLWRHLRLWGWCVKGNQLFSSRSFGSTTQNRMPTDSWALVWGSSTRSGRKRIDNRADDG